MSLESWIFLWLLNIYKVILTLKNVLIIHFFKRQQYDKECGFLYMTNKEDFAAMEIWLENHSITKPHGKSLQFEWKKQGNIKVYDPINKRGKSLFLS